MRRLVILLLLATLVTGAAGCKRRKKQAAAEEPAGLATMLHAADPRAAAQLISGFHDVEAGSWRWTQKIFGVILHPPGGAATKGANLLLKFSVPEVLLQKVGPITLSAKVGTFQTPPETYDSAGEKTYTREVPAAALKGDSVPVVFTLDKVMAPSEQDMRELGVIMSMVGFEARQ